MDCSLPGPSVHGTSQTRLLEWVAFPFSGGSSQIRDQTLISCVSCTGQQIVTAGPPWTPTGGPWLSSPNCKTSPMEEAASGAQTISDTTSFKKQQQQCRSQWDRADWIRLHWNNWLFPILWGQILYYHVQLCLSQQISLLSPLFPDPGIGITIHRILSYPIYLWSGKGK